MRCGPGTWERRLVAGDGDPLAEPARAALVADRSGFAGDWFLGVHNPPLRMAVVGAVHIAQALVPMARLAGYDVVVVDPREAFASAARFPGSELSHDWPDAALAEFGLDTRTAVVTLTHDPKLDDPAIVAALAGAGLLPRLPRLVADPRQAGRAAEGGGLRRGGRSRGSTHRSAPTSGRSRRRRSRWRSSPR